MKLAGGVFEVPTSLTGSLVGSNTLKTILNKEKCSSNIICTKPVG